jgi:hypothetical protein
MWAASPTFTAPSGSSVGPLVIAPQSGFEQRFAARFANVTMTACLNRSSVAMDTSLPATPNESQAIEQQKTFSSRL